MYFRTNFIVQEESILTILIVMFCLESFVLFWIIHIYLISYGCVLFYATKTTTSTLHAWKMVRSLIIILLPSL